MIIKRNWRDVHPTIAYQIGIDRRLLSSVDKAREDIQGSALDPEYRCLKTITYVSFAELQPHLSHEPFVHNNHEEIFYILNGTGKIKIGNEEARLRDGDIIYIPENTTHSIINDGEEMLKFLAFGGYTGKQKKKRSRKQK
jgi:mannose-6-phosphate isomerase-like protein (cupin superfamily)